ncbi:MAG: hypothetical protein HOP12_02585 [Candidatus Eisenbacteria bacterium]|uniref:Uncharacterized protein n=1 Tax=Eiseniibacteriota bacterium TaxID=2212470 RepID=A0A849SF15_UNCEI|nr:hypothetical protein [Candidatus Eisenbacteria bacterium]
MAAQTEVVAKAARRRFAAAEQVQILKEADGCTKPGELSALLRRHAAPVQATALQSAGPAR